MCLCAASVLCVCASVLCSKILTLRTGTAEVTGDVRLKSIERAILHKLPLSGIPGVNKVLRDHKKSQLLGFAHYNPVSKGIDMGLEEWFFETEGSNLLATLALPGVDAHRTICNDIKEVLQVSERRERLCRGSATCVRSWSWCRCWWC